MKISTTHTISLRVLVALTLSILGLVGFSSMAEAATCLSCHATPGQILDIRPVDSAFRNITTGGFKGSHVKHIPAATLDANACTSCHGPGVTSYLPNHRNGFINVTSATAPGLSYSKGSKIAQTGAANKTLGSCSTASCHANPYGSDTVATPVWGTAAANCSACHTTPIGDNGPETGSHTTVGGHAADCITCHADGTTATSMPSANHNDGNINIVNVGYPTTVAKHAAGSGYNSCSTASCHKNPYGETPATTPVWGTTGNGCAACHTVPIAAYGPNTGSHAKHNDGTCTDCHNAGTTQTSKPDTDHADGNVNVTNGYPVTAKHAAGTYTGTCNAASCHDNGKGVPATTPVWGATGVPACTACHALVPGDSHTKHVSTTLYAKVACTVCHTGYVQGTTAAANHINGTVEVNTGGYPSPKAKGSAFGACATSSCHSNGQSADGLSATPVYATVAPTWGGSAACGSCHAVLDIATGTHATHLTTGGATCNSCHTGADSGLTYNSTLHVNGQINVNGGYGYPTDKTPGNGYGTCVAAGGACHANPYGATTPAVTWGVNTPGACTACHNGANVITANGPATGSHTTVNGHKVACTFCHTAGTTATTVPAVETAIHKNDNIDVVGVGYAPTVALHAAGSGYGSCSAASCHNDPYSSGTVVTPNWGAISGCAACHTAGFAASGPATGSHVMHATSATCASCHGTGVSATVAPSANHNNGTVNAANYPATAKHTAGTYAGTCSNTANGCHGTMTTPVWGVASGNDKCTKCHGTGTPTASLTAANLYFLAPSDSASDTGKVSTDPKIGAHQTHLRFLNGFSNYSTVSYSCQGCHGTLPTASNHATGSAAPAFQGLAAQGTTATYNAGYCSVYCHNPVAAGLMTGNAGSNTAPLWNDPTYIVGDAANRQADCGKCHKVPGDSGFTKQEAHGAGMTTANDCSSCHGHNGTGKNHIDGKFYVDGGCSTCHGYPPVSAAQLVAVKAAGTFVNAKLEDYAGGGGYHTSHLAETVVIGDGFTPCLPCHPSTSHKQGGSTVVQVNINVFESTDTINRFDSSRSKRYDASLTKCSNISCHFKPSPAWNL